MPTPPTVTYYDFDHTHKRTGLIGKSWTISIAFKDNLIRSPWGFAAPISIHRLPGDIWLLKGEVHGTRREFYGRLDPNVANDWLAAAGHDAPKVPQMRDLLDDNPRLTADKIARRLGVSSRTVKRSPVWKEHQARKKADAHERGVCVSELTRSPLGVNRVSARDPAEIIAVNKIREKKYNEDFAPGQWDAQERRYLSKLTYEQRGEYRQMSRAEKEHEVKTWWLCNVT
jgi:hypothetical protein